LSKISSVETNQDITARILGFGSVVINGVGNEKTLIPGISKVNDFRAAISREI